METTVPKGEWFSLFVLLFKVWAHMFWVFSEELKDRTRSEKEWKVFVISPPLEAPKAKYHFVLQRVVQPETDAIGWARYWHAESLKQAEHCFECVTAFTFFRNQPSNDYCNCFWPFSWYRRMCFKIDKNTHTQQLKNINRALFEMYIFIAELCYNEVHYC